MSKKNSSKKEEFGEQESPETSAVRLEEIKTIDVKDPAIIEKIDKLVGIIKEEKYDKQRAWATFNTQNEQVHILRAPEWKRAAKPSLKNPTPEPISSPPHLVVHIASHPLRVLNGRPEQPSKNNGRYITLNRYTSDAQFYGGLIDPYIYSVLSLVEEANAQLYGRNNSFSQEEIETIL